MIWRGIDLEGAMVEDLASLPRHPRIVVPSPDRLTLHLCLEGEVAEVDPNFAQATATTWSTFSKTFPDDQRELVPLAGQEPWKRFWLDTGVDPPGGTYRFWVKRDLEPAETPDCGEGFTRVPNTTITIGNVERSEVFGEGSSRPVLDMDPVLERFETRSVVEVSGITRTGAGFLINPAGHVATAAHNLTANNEPGCDFGGWSGDIRVTFPEKALTPGTVKRTFKYERLGDGFPSYFPFCHQLAILRPAEPLPLNLAGRPWLPIVSPNLTGSGCSLNRQPAEYRDRKEGGRVKWWLMRAPVAGEQRSDYLTSAGANLGPIQINGSFEDGICHAPWADITERYLPKYRWTEPRFSGSPVFDANGDVWGIHVDDNRAMWAFEILAQYEVMRRARETKPASKG